jgi:hypothetical protein
MNNDERNDLLNLIEHLRRNGPGKGKSLDMIEKAIMNKEVREFEKPVVPKFVSNWIEERLTDVPYDLYGLYKSEKFKNSPVQEWVEESQGNSEKFENAWKNGYEVEKEKKYRVRFPNPDRDDTYLYKMIFPQNQTSIHFSEEPRGSKNLLTGNMLFTEVEIKDIDERYWQFAEEVEENE